MNKLIIVAISCLAVVGCQQMSRSDIDELVSSGVDERLAQLNLEKRWLQAVDEGITQLNLEE